MWLAAYIGFGLDSHNPTTLLTSLSLLPLPPQHSYIHLPHYSQSPIRRLGLSLFTGCSLWSCLTHNPRAAAAVAVAVAVIGERHSGALRGNFVSVAYLHPFPFRNPLSPSLSHFTPLID